jgi:hypothetical protein
MMKKLLLCSAVFLMGTAMSFAQFANIGILGGSTVTGWDSDTDMVTTDGVTYTLNNVVITVPPANGGVKFRQDDAWTINWGSDAWPTGTGTQGGANIPAVDGTYDVTFNITTGAYTFAPAGVEYDAVSLVGASGATTLATSDGINYFADNIMLEAGNMLFRVNDAAVGWGGTSFPSGTATEGSEIPVLANSYNITFNKQTGAYNFGYVTISLIGAGVVNWDTDTDLSTTDGINYTLNNFTFAGGEAKFRLNHAWGTGWGGTGFPNGTGSSAPDAPNFVINAGTYNVMFNRLTGEYMFMDPTAGISNYEAITYKVYPNPTQNVWNFSAANSVINNLQIVDISGKVIFSAANSATVDATSFASGVYFARVTSANAVQTIRVIKN